MKYLHYRFKEAPFKLMTKLKAITQHYHRSSGCCWRCSLNMTNLKQCFSRLKWHLTLLNLTVKNIFLKYKKSSEALLIHSSVNPPRHGFMLQQRAEIIFQRKLLKWLPLWISLKTLWWISKEAKWHICHHELCNVSSVMSSPQILYSTCSKSLLNY